MIIQHEEIVERELKLDFLPRTKWVIEIKSL